METVTSQIVKVFESFRMAPTPVDQYDQVGKGLLIKKIDAFVQAHSPVRFAMLGYPFKSANERDKVIGKLPDLAEEVSLKNFANFNDQVKEVYQPGVDINIINDGLVFNDLMEIEDKTVRDYAEGSQELGRVAPMTWHNLTTFYPKGSLSENREALMVDFGISDTELERRILTDPDVNFLYKGMVRFMGEELAIKNFVSNNQKQKAAKILVRKMMSRNEAYSNLVKTEFSTHIRLSMHQSTNNGAKYSFRLIPGDKAFRSPWHCALYINDQGEYETLHRKEAEAQGLHIVEKNGRPYYFTK